MAERASHSGVLTLCGQASVAFIVACVAHEALGHGAACLVIGGHIRLLTSVYFQCSRSAPVVDAAGPLMNLVVAAVATFALRFTVRRSHSSILLGLIIAYSGFWGAGYLIFSAVTNTGDFAFALRVLALQPTSVWRLGMGLAGWAMYRILLRRVMVLVPTGLPLVMAYAAAALVGCLSVLFHQGPVLPALQEAALESVLAPVGLLWVALRKPVISPTLPVANTGVLASSIAVTLVFWVTQGRGLFGP